MFQRKGHASLNKRVVPLRRRRVRANTFERRIKDLEWQVQFAKNHIFYCVERRRGEADKLVAYRDRALMELKQLKNFK